MVTETTFRRHVPDEIRLSLVHLSDGWPLRAMFLPPYLVDEGALEIGALLQEPRGSILFLGGRGDFYEKYLETLSHWALEGWAVSSFDWRGQGGSGRLGKGPFSGHIDDFSIWIADLAAVVERWLAERPGPHFIIAHSMGGHILLRYLAEYHPPIRGAIVVAPMVAFKTPMPKAVLKTIAQCQISKGYQEYIAWGQAKTAPTSNRLRQRRLTSDEARYADELWWVGQKPELGLGGASWGWLCAAMDSCQQLQVDDYLEAISVPVLLVAANGDQVVDTPAAVQAVQRISQHEAYIYDGAHELLRERDAVRNDILMKIAGFCKSVHDE